MAREPSRAQLPHTQQPRAVDWGDTPGSAPEPWPGAWGLSGSAPQSRATTLQQPPPTYPSRKMTPVERREAQLQELTARYTERVRDLGAARQRILRAQVEHLGSAQPIESLPGDAQTRAAERHALVEQLIAEQGPAQAMLEKLQEGRTLAQARQAGLDLLMTNTSGRPASIPDFLLSTQDRGDASGRAAPAVSDAAGAWPPSTGVDGGRRPHFLTDTHTRSVSHYSSRHGSSRAGPQSAADVDDQGDGDQGSWDGGSGWEEQQGLPAGASTKSNRSRAASSAARMDPPSTNVRELRQQVEELRTLVETQLQHQQRVGVAAAPQPIIMPMPWYPNNNMVQQQQQQAQQQMQGTQGPELATQSSLAEGLVARDPALQDALARHGYDMTLMRMEIERARSVAELEQIRTVLGELRARQGATQMGQQGRAAQAAQAPPPRDQVAPPQPPGGTAGSITTPGLEQDFTMTDVPPRHLAQAPDQAARWQEQGSEEDSELYYEEDVLDDHPPTMLPGTAVRADVLNVRLASLGPVLVRGSYRVRLVLFEGFQPLYVSPDVVVGCSTVRRSPTRQNGAQVVDFAETLTLRGLSLTPTMVLVFELYVAKAALAGMPSREDLTAWTFCEALSLGQVVSGRQSLPMYRLPIMLSANRHFSYNNAMLDVSISHAEGEQGEGVVLDPQGAPGQGAGLELGGTGGVAQAPSGGGPGAADAAADTAWLRVARGTPPSEPFTPGDGLVVIVDHARFLPASVTVSKVTVTVFSSDRRALSRTCEVFSAPDSDAFNPRYGAQVVVGQGAEKFDNAAATLLLTVYTADRWGGQVGVVGYACLPCFLDPRTKQQPLSKNIQDYVLNVGAFQVPLHTSLAPPSTGPFRGSSLEDASPRLPCASLLVRVMTPELAKQHRRQPPPLYQDRVYDSMRAQPTAIERTLFAKYQARKPLLVREAARLLAGLLAGNVATGGAGLPGTDPELLDWIEARLALEPGARGPPPSINYNFASEYYPDLGFFVCVDGAMRLPRNLPAGALVTFSPPGSFYQDTPVVDDVKVVLAPDMDSCLAAPRWLDGPLHFTDVLHEPGMAVLIDVRLLVPGAGSSSPAGWTVLPVFERAGAFVATGAYHLPLFQGVPSRNILQEFVNKGDVDAVVIQQLRAKRLKPHEEFCSVLVRLCDVARQGQLGSPLNASSAQLPGLRVPAYVTELGPKFLAMMRRDVQNKTYAQAKPPDLSEDGWLDLLAACICQAAGLKPTAGTLLLGSDDDEDEESVI